MLIFNTLHPITVTSMRTDFKDLSETKDFRVGTHGSDKIMVRIGMLHSTNLPCAIVFIDENSPIGVVNFDEVFILHNGKPKKTRAYSVCNSYLKEQFRGLGVMSTVYRLCSKRLKALIVCDDQISKSAAKLWRRLTTESLEAKKRVYVLKRMTHSYMCDSHEIISVTTFGDGHNLLDWAFNSNKHTIRVAIKE